MCDENTQTKNTQKVKHNAYFNPFTGMMLLENNQQKCEILRTYALLFRFSHWHVKDFFMKTHSIESRCVIGPETILFAGSSLHMTARKLYRLGQ